MKYLATCSRGSGGETVLCIYNDIAVEYPILISYVKTSSSSTTTLAIMTIVIFKLPSPYSSWSSVSLQSIKMFIQRSNQLLKLLFSINSINFLFYYLYTAIITHLFIHLYWYLNLLPPRSFHQLALNPWTNMGAGGMFYFIFGLQSSSKKVKKKLKN